MTESHNKSDGEVLCRGYVTRLSRDGGENLEKYQKQSHHPITIVVFFQLQLHDVSTKLYKWDEAFGSSVLLQ